MTEARRQIQRLTGQNELLEKQVGQIRELEREIGKLMALLELERSKEDN